MAFSFEHDESLGDGVLRIIRTQLAKAMTELDGTGVDDLPAVVHGVRKRGKRVRAVLRLVRPVLGDDYDSVNIAVRDAGRRLASIRDAHALLGTFDALTAGCSEDRVDVGLLGVRSGLVRRAQEESAAARQNAVTGEVTALLGSARARVDDWSLDDGFETIGPGLRATYRRGRRGWRAAIDHPSPEALHEWRKSAKFLWHQTELLGPSAPLILDPLADALHALSDTLGDSHDLVVLCDLLKADPDAFGGWREVDGAVVLADRCRTDLNRRAVGLGARLYAERPTAFVDRQSRYMHAWQTLGDEQAAGEIAAIAPPDDGVAGLSRRALYNLARTADVRGRSTMGRDDLLGSLRAAAP